MSCRLFFYLEPCRFARRIYYIQTTKAVGATCWLLFTTVLIRYIMTQRIVCLIFSIEIACLLLAVTFYVWCWKRNMCKRCDARESAWKFISQNNHRYTEVVAAATAALLFLLLRLTHSRSLFVHLFALILIVVNEKTANISTYFTHKHFILPPHIRVRYVSFSYRWNVKRNV